MPFGTKHSLPTRILELFRVAHSLGLWRTVCHQDKVYFKQFTLNVERADEDDRQNPFTLYFSWMFSVPIRQKRHTAAWDVLFPAATTSSTWGHMHCNSAALSRVSLLFMLTSFGCDHRHQHQHHHHRNYLQGLVILDTSVCKFQHRLHPFELYITYTVHIVTIFISTNQCTR